MSILVLAEDYPNQNGGISMNYVHTRNLLYKEMGLDCTVLNFRAKESYNIDGIQVLCYQDYIGKKGQYEYLISHAPNLKHHYTFLKKHGKSFRHFCFFFHGHEVLRIHKVYPKPYPYKKENPVSVITRDLYDTFKLAVWRQFFQKNYQKSTFVFVSQWMEDEFFKWTGIDRNLLLGQCFITYNGIGRKFENTQFDGNCSKDYDFLTIRGNLDGSKYCIDMVNQIAKQNPQYRFLLVGRGKFFNYNAKADNLEWRDTTLSHEQILNLIQKSRIALMPTRTDAQGLMMCEIASTGMPLITSNIPVCREIFRFFDNVIFIQNDQEKYDLSEMIRRFSSKSFEKKTTYYSENTGKKEIELIRSVCP